MSDQPTTLSDAIDIGLLLHDQEVQERLRRREERNRRQLARLNQAAGTETEQRMLETQPAAASIASAIVKPAPVVPRPQAPVEPNLAPASPAPDAEAVPARTSQPRTARSAAPGTEASKTVETSPEMGVSTAAVPPHAVLNAQPASSTPSTDGEAARRPRGRPRKAVAAPPSEPEFRIDPAASVRTEALPNERFLKVRNSIVDSLARFLKGNRYTVFQHIYRNTLGRQNDEAFFVSRLVAQQLNVSEKTVRTCWKDLERLGLIQTASVQGSHFGMRIRVLDVEAAIERLGGPAPAHPASAVIFTAEDTPSAVNFTADQRQFLPLSDSFSGKFYRGSAVKFTAEDAPSAVNFTGLSFKDKNHEIHEKDMITTAAASVFHGKKENEKINAAVAAQSDLVRERFASEMTTKYNYAPHLALNALSCVRDDQLELIPALFAKLDDTLDRNPRIKNPAGMLATWISNLEAWANYGSQKNDPARSDQPRSTDAPAANDETTDLYVAYLTALDEKTEALLSTLSADEIARRADDARAAIRLRVPAADRWSDAHWELVLKQELKRTLRTQCETFDEWLHSRS